MRRFAYALLLSAGIVLIAWGKEVDPYAGWDGPSPDRPSLRVAWGVPLKGGPIRVLFIAPRFTLRDVVELSERLDLKFDVVPVWDAHHLGGVGDRVAGASPEATAAHLRDRLGREYDVLVMGNLDLSILPGDILAGIVEKVKGGMGLVLAHYREHVPAPFQEFLDTSTPSSDAFEEITRGVGASMTPEWPSSLDFVKASRHERGRVVRLDYAGDRPFTHFLAPSLTDPLKAREDYFETYMSLVARAVRWAAGRGAPLMVTRVEAGGPSGPAEEEIPPGLPEAFVQQMKDAAREIPYRPFRIQLNAPADRTYRVRAQVREPHRGLRTLYPELPPLRKGAVSYLLELPVGPGAYFLDLWFLEKKSVVEWHTEPVTVAGWPAISDVAYSKGWLLPNDALTVSLNVRPEYHRPRPCTVYVRATDSLKRVVAEGRQVVDSEGGHAEVTLQFADLLGNLVKVEVFAADSTGPRLSRWDLDRAAYHHLYVPVRAPRPLSAFSFAVESRAEAEYNARQFLRTFVSLGVDSAYTPATDEARFYLAEANIRPIPDLTCCVPDSAEQGKAREPGLADPAARQLQDKQLHDRVPGFWAVGTALYSAGKGACPALDRGEACERPAILEGFHAALQTEYGTIAALNQAWGAQFTSWRDIAPDTREKAAASGRYAAWVAFRGYLDGVFTGTVAHAADVVHGIDADARVGFEAIPASTADTGYDWWSLATRLDLLAVPPDSVSIEMARSYRTPKSYAALCFGGDADTSTPAWARWFPWCAALHGMQGVWRRSSYGGSDLDGACFALAPDGSVSPVFLETVRSMNRLRSGLGTLLVNATRKKADIGIYGSQSSLYVTEADPAFGCTARQAEAAFARLLADLGYAYDFVSPAQARQGKLREYKLIILPMSRSLGDDEIEVIRKFHDQGGRLLADAAPGEIDARGARRGGFSLDDLFGIRHVGPARAEACAEAAVQAGREPGIVSGTLESLTVDAAVEIATGAAGGKAHETPIWITQSSEREFTAVLLNHTLPPCLERNESGLADLLGALLENSGVARVVSVTPVDGRILHGECVALRYGEADIVGLLADPRATKDQKLVLDWDKNRNVYNMEQGKRLTRAKKTKVKLAPGDTAVFCVLPYAVSQVSVETPNTVEAGRRLPVRISIKTRETPPGKHLVHVTLNRGLANPAPYYARDIVCERGEGQTYIPLALNEARGTYTVVVRDVLSGMTAQTSVAVGPRFERNR